MTRLSGDEIRCDRVWNGFDYELQVWVVTGIMQRCGHRETICLQGRSCLNAYRLAGGSIVDVPNAQKIKGRGDRNLLTESHGISQAPSHKAS